MTQERTNIRQETQRTLQAPERDPNTLTFKRVEEITQGETQSTSTLHLSAQDATMREERTRNGTFSILSRLL